MLEQAIEYAKRGLSVVPAHTIRDDGKCSCDSSTCSAPGKHPRLRWQGRTQTALTLDELMHWWRKYPDSNIGIVTGKISNLVVLDVDGEEGLKSLKEFKGFDHEAVPAPTVRTGGGGLHIYYCYPEGLEVTNRIGVLHKVDVRADGGFVVAPPSIHNSGKSYQWLKGRSLDDLDPPEVNLEWMARKYEERKKRSTKEDWYEKLLAGVGEGGRNEAATKLAGRYLGMGMETGEVLLLLSAWNHLNDPPLPHAEIERTVHSIAEREGKSSEKRSHEDTLAFISRALKSEVSLEKVRWITGSEPKIYLIFNEGVCEMTSGTLLNPGSFQRAILKDLKMVVRKLSTKTNPTHESLVGAILSIREEIDAGDEATEAGSLMDLVQDFVDSQKLTQVADEDSVPVKGTFRMGEKIWFSLKDLAQRSASEWKIVRSIPDTAQKLRAMGFEQQTMTTDEGGTRKVWGCNSRLLGRAKEDTDDSE